MATTWTLRFRLAKAGGRYITVGDERRYLGWFRTATEAHHTHIEAKRKFHPFNTL